MYAVEVEIWPFLIHSIFLRFPDLGTTTFLWHLSIVKKGIKSIWYPKAKISIFLLHVKNPPPQLILRGSCGRHWLIFHVTIPMYWPIYCTKVRLPLLLKFFTFSSEVSKSTNKVPHRYRNAVCFRLETKVDKIQQKTPKKQNQRGTRTILKMYFTVIYNSKETWKYFASFFLLCQNYAPNVLNLRPNISM